MCELINGFGLCTDEMHPYLDAVKLRNYLEIYQPSSTKESSLTDWMELSNGIRLELLIGKWGLRYGFADVLCNAAKCPILAYGQNTEGKNYLYFPRGYLWEMGKYASYTQEDAEHAILDVVLAFSFDEIPEWDRCCYELADI